MCIPGPICLAARQRWHMGTSPEGDSHHTCPWPHIPLTARTATVSLCHLVPGTFRLTRFPLQVEGGTAGSRDATATAHAGTAEAVSGAGPLIHGETLQSLCSSEGNWDQLCWEGPCPTGDVICCVCPMLHLSQCAHLLFFQDHSTKAGKGAVPMTDLRSLSPVRGGHGQPGQVVGREGSSPAGLGLVPQGPLCCWHWHPLLFLGRAK